MMINSGGGVTDSKVATTRSRGTTVSGQSGSTCGSVASHVSRSEVTVMTPARENAFNRLNQLDINDVGSPGAASNKKKRGQRAAAGDKNGRGLRQFSMKVCEKVESKGRTTYNEVADELVAEFADISNCDGTPDQSPNSFPDENVTSAVRSESLSSPTIADVIQKIDVNPPKGTRDFPPEDMRLRSWLFNHFREVSQLFGFEEIDFPVLESEALYIRKAGEEIRDQLYCFEDRGNRRVALRPELTPSLARLVIQKGKSLSIPIKWFAIGQCWRYERMTRGRRREHYQWNMDIIGVPEVTAEAELISSIVTFFKRLGITAADVGFKISSRKVLQEVLRRYSIPENLFGKVCVIIDKMEKIPIDEMKKELKSADLTEEVIDDLLQVLSIKSFPELEEKLGAGEAVEDLKQLFSLAEKYGFSEWIQFDASVVRGLAYYTGIVFEGFDRGRKLRAICGGGRYNHLLSTFGGDDVPACGFGFGDAVIVELLKDKGLLPELKQQVENIVCSLDRDLQGAAASVATILREKGQTVDLVMESKPLKWVFKRATRINANRLILVGNSEWQRGTVVVKTLSTGEQSEVKIDELK